MGSAYLEEGRRCLAECDWAGAINALSWARELEPADVGTYLLLIETYERAAAAEKEPDLLQQGFNVCRDLRDRRLPMSVEQQETFYRAFLRVRDAVIAARRNGWTPPPPKEQVHTLFDKPRAT
ncbi:MAG TPA: hypothetical protein VFT43_02615 [Candidatus Polarisedimenticolia bacterium]|nr:hypothetical protein [Candidatus Polarisedimenticolia bacterium]